MPKQCRPARSSYQNGEAFIMKTRSRAHGWNPAFVGALNDTVTVRLLNRNAWNDKVEEWVLSTSAEPNSDHSIWMTHHFLRGLMKDRALPNRLVFVKYGPHLPVGGRPLSIITLFRRLSSVCAFSQRKYVRLISVTWDTEHVLGKNSSAPNRFAGVVTYLWSFWQ